MSPTAIAVACATLGAVAVLLSCVLLFGVAVAVGVAGLGLITLGLAIDDRSPDRGGRSVSVLRRRDRG